MTVATHFWQLSLSSEYCGAGECLPIARRIVSSATPSSV